MKIKFRHPKGLRTYKGTVKVPHKPNRIHIYIGLESYDNLWWCDELNKWIEINNDNKNYSISSMSKPIKSVKAAINHIKKHDEIPKGARMTLVSSFVGCDVEIIK